MEEGWNSNKMQNGGGGWVELGVWPTYCMHSVSCISYKWDKIVVYRCLTHVYTMNFYVFDYEMLTTSSRNRN